MGVSILAGSLAFVGAANAIDLIQNGSFENTIGGSPSYNCREDGTDAGWVGLVSCINYSFAYFDGPPIPASENPGHDYAWKLQSAAGAYQSFVTPTNIADFLQYDLKYALKQTVNLTNAASSADLDAGRGQYTFSAWLASYGKPHSNPEQPFLDLRFFDITGTNQLGADVIFDHTDPTHAVVYADGTSNFPGNLGNDHNWIKYVATGAVPAGARKATIYVTRSPNAGVSGRPDTYVDLVKLNVISTNDTTVLDSSVPVDGETAASPDVAPTVTLRDVRTAVNTNSIQYSFDGSSVTPSITKSAGYTTVKYDPPGLLVPYSSHNYKVVWSDNGVPTVTKSNQFQFAVEPYANFNLGPPIYLENFDELAEGSLPTGWSVSNMTDSDLSHNDLRDFHSDSYLNWVVISSSTLSTLFNVVPGGTDYIPALNVAPNQFVNGLAVTNLINTNFIFAASADRFGNQVQYLFTRDYNLSGKTNVYLSFHNIYVQNQNSLGAVEYSINGGASWLPALYMLDGPDVLRDSSGNIDASNTFATVYTNGEAPPPPGNYGAFIGVSQSQWASLGPYLSARIDDDQSESKRVEIVRLTQADNQAAVRFRMAQAGANSWYFGIDDFGLYSITTTNPPLVTAPPASQTVEVGNTATLTFSAVGIPPFSYQWRRNGLNLSGRTSDQLTFSNLHLSDGGTYDVIISNPGGSTTSAPPATLTVRNAAVFVTGQWDFNSNLVATCGQDLQFYDISVQTNTTFGTTTAFSISDINAQPTVVMRLTPPSANAGGGGGVNPDTNAWGGYKMFHGAAANGGGTRVNQYTLIFDVLYPDYVDLSWRAVIQASTTVTNGGDDSEFYINRGDGIGISGIYDGNITPDVWHRIALAVDMGGPGPHPVVAKFIDGVKVGEQTDGLDVADGRFSLNPALALLFSENNAFNNDAYVSSVQFSNGRRSDEFIEALGAPSSSKIPGCITARLESGNVVIRWTGGVPLQSADAVNGPWTTVNGAASPYMPPGGSTKFYRPKIP